MPDRASYFMPEYRTSKKGCSLDLASGARGLGNVKEVAQIVPDSTRSYLLLKIWSIYFMWSNSYACHFQTITTATSTVSSTTACYATAGTPTTACSKRRKRAIEMNPFGDHEMQEKIMATSPVRISRMNNKKKNQSVRRSKVMDLNQVSRRQFEQISRFHSKNDLSKYSTW